ncbi:DUF2339 domain-containing protein [Massilia sp. CFBP 13647]|nr:DUF2339 domain-containing protein [Massilia sp. CFBP 13647]MBD8674298.1 DUF2339 domain-containing protein [Massilia sp. CFBP 13721]
MAAKTWLLTGNLVAKLGLVILFAGVAFLLKYVAATVTIPIELRLAGVVLADLAMLGWGWRIRGARREISLPIQGTAIAILMLVIFGAYHRYELMPAAFAFTLLVLLTAFTCLLAVLQDAPWLAAFGITGGFACPLMVSSGQGNHVALFSYYALLNAGVFALAIKRAWRPLNLLGFGFTFIVGTAWGGLRYTGANYGSAQGFLILFFLMYVGVALAFARQQQTRLKHYVDATLVLGTPLLAFGLQAGLMRDKPFGLALSALALGGFYLVLALLLLHRGRERWRVLVEAFLALGAIFGTLAIPFALDGRWTSAAWALEGAGFVWFGLKRGQCATWIFGLLLQAGAWLSFIGAATGLDTDTARDANLGLGFLLLAGSAFVMAHNFHQHADAAHPALARIANWSITIAALWLLAGTWSQAILHTSGGTLANLLAAGALLTAEVLYLASTRMAWPRAKRLALLAQLAGACALAVVVASMALSHGAGLVPDAPLLGVLMIALAALATSRMLDRSAEQTGAKKLPAALLLWGGAWWFGPTLWIGADRLVDYMPAGLGLSGQRWDFLYALGVSASAAACLPLARRLAWPRLRWLGAASWGALAMYTVAVLGDLYGSRALPAPAAWLGWAALLAGGEYMLLRWDRNGAPLAELPLRAVHALRTAGPWLALWPTGAVLIGRWLVDGSSADQLAAQGNWAIGSAWGNYLPTWAMMLVLAWLARRSAAAAWPTAPLQDWYRTVLIPAGALLILLLAAVWNLGQDGTMAPLPYIPLLNPLDLTAGFALVLCASAGRMLAGARPGLSQRLRVATVGAAWAWFNLILLRSAAHYLGIAYQFEDLAASQFVQAMLSLVWSASALVLMRFAAQRTMRRTWATGAVLLGVVLVKLVMVDMASGGSMARIVSFVGVGLLMVLVGYLAPYPKSEAGAASPQRST